MADLPSIPDIPPGTVNSELLEPMKEIIETREGVRGMVKQRNVTFQDLIDLGLITEADLPE